jgi:uncharacterized protein YvpB
MVKSHTILRKMLLWTSAIILAAIVVGITAGIYLSNFLQPPIMQFSFDLAGEQNSWLYLPVPYHNQRSETDDDLWNPNNTCMATALTMVLDYKGLESDVNAIIELLAEIEPLKGGYDPGCRENPVCASAGAVAKVAEMYCASVTAGDGWSREDVVNELKNGRPVLAVVSGRLVPGAFGHAITITGFLDNGNRVIFHDPLGSGKDPAEKGNSIATWEELAASWAGPVDVNDPLQPEGHSYWGLSCAD